MLEKSDTFLHNNHPGPVDPYIYVLYKKKLKKTKSEFLFIKPLSGLLWKGPVLYYNAVTAVSVFSMQLLLTLVVSGNNDIVIILRKVVLSCPGRVRHAYPNG